MIILGIETSCDETAIAVMEAKGSIESPSFRLLGSAIHSQVDMHQLYGGVYPNLAKREHIKNLPIVLEQALEKAEISMDKIDTIAVTVGPGLEPALWTGITFAQELSSKYTIPLIPTNHMQGHVASVLLSGSKISFPALALLISGGHTEIVLLNSWSERQILGETVDDAVGEAFDKVARMLGAPYPGGPEISRLAEEARQKNIIMDKKLPRPMLHSGNLNFSFSGLKTAVLYYLRDHESADKLAIAREFEDAVVEVLVEKVKTAIALYNPHTLLIGGGVIANKLIRDRFLELRTDNMEVLIPEKSLTTDNAVMIAMAGYLTHLNGEKIELKADGNLSL